MIDADSTPRPEYEPEDAHPRWVAAIMAAMAVFVAVGIVVGLFYRRGDLEAGGASPVTGPDRLFQNGPYSKTGIQRSWDELDRAAAAEPDGYAWIDRRAGTVRIPIDRAIDLVCSEQDPQGRRADPREARP